MEPELYTRPQKAKAPNPGFVHLQQQVSGLGSRLAVLEERLSNLRKQTQLTEQQLIDDEKERRTDLRAHSDKLLELSRKIEDIKEIIDGMYGELSTVVKKHEFSVLQKYMDYWEPLQFITRDEAKLLIEESRSR